MGKICKTLQASWGGKKGGYVMISSVKKAGEKDQEKK